MNLFRSSASLMIPGFGWICLEAEGGAITRAYFGDTSVTEGDPDPILIEALQQMQEYLNGERKSFDLFLQPAGTPFQNSVWKALQSVPHGQTLTYKQFASGLADVKSTRAVASAIGANPIAVIIPCHRIVGAKGDLTGYAWGIDRKEWLLNKEQGVEAPSIFDNTNVEGQGQ